MHKYEMTIFWSDEDETFIADVPELAIVRTLVIRRRRPWPVCLRPLKVFSICHGNLETRFLNPKVGG